MLLCTSLTTRRCNYWKIGPIRVSGIYFKLWKVEENVGLKEFGEAEGTVHIQLYIEILWTGAQPLQFHPQVRFPV